jgi:flagellar biosynthesis protein FlhG
MLTDQAQALRELVMESGEPGGSDEVCPRIITIASGKGGVGKSNIAVNLAIRLSTMGRRVVLLDADLGTANADVLCNLSSRGNLAHVVAGRWTLNQAMVEAPGGFRLIPGASGLAQMAALSEFEKDHLLRQVRGLGGDTDLVLIDTGAGIGPNLMTFALAADDLLVVTTPEPTAVTDAYAVIKVVTRQRPDADIRLLVNMVKDAAEARGVYDRIESVCRRFLNVSPRYAGHMVHDPRITAAVRRRRPFVLDSPSCEASVCIGRLAHRLDRHGSLECGSQSLFHRMTNWLTG